MNVKPKHLSRYEGGFHVTDYKKGDTHYSFKPSLNRLLDDPYPIYYEERIINEVLTNSVIMENSNDYKMFWDSVALIDKGQTNEKKDGYQYDPKYKRPFPFMY